MSETKYIKNEDIQKRQVTEHFFECPHCGDEVSDFDVGFGDPIECPNCYGQIRIGEPSYTLKNGKTFKAIGLNDPLTKQEFEDLKAHDQQNQLVTPNEVYTCKTPALLSDGEGGTILLKEEIESCPDCDGKTTSRWTYVHEGTKNKQLVELGIGASVKHYFTRCEDCGLELGS